MSLSCISMCRASFVVGDVPTLLRTCARRSSCIAPTGFSPQQKASTRVMNARACQVGLPSCPLHTFRCCTLVQLHSCAELTHSPSGRLPSDRAGPFARVTPIHCRVSRRRSSLMRATSLVARLVLPQGPSARPWSTLRGSISRGPCKWRPASVWRSKAGKTSRRRASLLPSSPSPSPSPQTTHDTHPSLSANLSHGAALVPSSPPPCTPLNFSSFFLISSESSLR